jgi:DNA sulfur modification protein DndE
LKFIYPELDEKEKMAAWAAHVEDGIASIRNHRKLVDLAIVI